MTRSARESAPWILWPFAALWDLMAFVLALTGRLLAALIGLTLMIVGLLLTLTVVGAPVGIPVTVLGFLLIVRSLF